MMTDHELRDRLRRLFRSQSLGVLATSDTTRVHATLVAFAVSDDLSEALFATSRATRKFEMLNSNPKTALLVDDRGNRVDDFRDAVAATIHGPAEEVSGTRRKELEALYLEKHPYLSDFLRAPSCALLRIAVESYDLVRNFQEVHVLRLVHGSDSAD
jgi:nitroimidazol reductase NimA-like FMN-containing flavoprotein (pyridoxamine 5'-phosphate oxidase superfamily)